MRITIIGAGNSGLIHAAKLAENNFEVAILKTSDSGNVDFFNTIAKDSAYDVVDLTNHGKHFRAKMAFITRDVDRAIAFEAA